MYTIVILLVLVALFMALKAAEGRQQAEAPPSSWLDTPLAAWGHEDPFTVRDLLRSLVIMGASGSGKTSSVGKMLGRALVRCGRVSMLIIASKPEDREMWEEIARENGRRLVVFGPGQPHRFNLLEYESKNGADARELTQCLMTINELFTKSGGVTNESFWLEQQRRQTHNAIEPILRAHGQVSTWGIQEFITNAAYSPEYFEDKEWLAGYHNSTMKLAYDAAHGEDATPIARNDFNLARQYWNSEFPQMAEKTRSSILAHTMGLLHVFNTGIVRELIGTESTITPEIFDEGALVLVDMPVANYGLGGKFVAGAWKYATQRHILRRAATERTPVCCIWSDEFQNHITSFDFPFMSECRSHLGCQIVLTQSLHSFFASIGGAEAQSKTKGLLSNFAFKVFMALGDAESAQYASSLAGKDVVLRLSASKSHKTLLSERMYEGGTISTSIAEQLQELILPRLFMNGLRTGGPLNNFICDGWVVKNGEAFSDGTNAKFVEFTQR